MKISKFYKVHKDILIEYIYNDSNLIGEQYDILVNIKDNINSYASGENSGTNNILSNHLFLIDPVSNKYGKIDLDYYSFLQKKSYSAGIPVKYDTIKIHMPINYNFDEYIGCYIRVYTLGYDNKSYYNLSNFYFDKTDIGKLYLLNYNSPPFLFQEKMWGKHLKIEIPSVDAISSQRENNVAKENSINANLTNGIGLSLKSPIFIDFHFIKYYQTVNGITTYILTHKTTFATPQTPEFKQLGLVVEHSKNGDFFEIYGTYNGNASEFDNFIKNSYQLGHRYYVQYLITLFEENIKGKTITINVYDDFDEKIEYRPIIKNSTTTAIIDVEMRLIDAVDDSYIIRKASYGMLPDETSKYSLYLSKINIKNALKPKIYNMRTGGLQLKSSNINLGGDNNKEVVFHTVKIPFPVMVETHNVIAKSDNAYMNNNSFYPMGKLNIMLYPFDNIIGFVIATDISVDSEDSNQMNIKYMDLSYAEKISLVFKNTTDEVVIPLYKNADIDLSIGKIFFKIPQGKMSQIRKIYESKMNFFYITTTSNNTTSVIYSGIFTIYDSILNSNILNSTYRIYNGGEESNPDIIPDPSII